ncbi:MAG TPA: serine hydrolase domain-containing protein [Steroidobacteraceae bacterium]|nr:serine hydrolase domain-containing protein [Steroidobacteraceae bacterium]
MRTLRSSLLVVLVLCLGFGAAQARTVNVPEAKPEAVGFSSERLKRLDAGMKAIVDNKQLAGVSTIVTRHGQIVQQMTYGQKDIASNSPLEKDTIVRIYSMTKPITGVAMMILYEEGKWKPSDPISRHIPEFKDLKVFKSLDADGKPVTEAPGHAPTMGELLSHTAGFTYGLFGNSPVDKMYGQQNLLGAGSLKEFIDKLAPLPLAYEPGQGWVYSVSVDIQGYLVEKLSGQPFADFLRTRIFEPLGMNDTAFYVPENKLSRLATVYQLTPEGLKPMPRDPNVSKAPGFPSGGGGLYSTGLDYLRFAQMLANRGELGGVRILAPSSVALMTTNHVPEAVKAAGKFGIGAYRQQPGFGFGFDVAIYEDPTRLGTSVGKGTYLWDGIAGTWFWIDPVNDIVFVGIIQRWAGPSPGPNIEDLSRALTMQALIDPSK